MDELYEKSINAFKEGITKKYIKYEIIMLDDPSKEIEPDDEPITSIKLQMYSIKDKIQTTGENSFEIKRDDITVSFTCEQ